MFELIARKIKNALGSWGRNPPDAIEFYEPLSDKTLNLISMWMISTLFGLSSKGLGNIGV